MSSDVTPPASPAPFSSFPPAVAGALTWARARWESLSRPARVLALSTAVMGIALAAWISVRAANVPYGVLYAQLERDDAGALVAKLRELKIPYRLEGETTLMVPAARVHEVRLELANLGLPRGGGVGFESFDRMRLGATEFEQRVLYRRALEGEIARTVSAVAAVQSARVHLVLPERSVFVSRTEPASASVVLRLHPGASLGRGEVQGVVHVVAAAVPNLDANHVTLMTTDGRMLHRPRAEGEDPSLAGNGEEDPTQRARTMETLLEERVRNMLERVVGEQHVDVRATVEMDLARVERVEDSFDPQHTALRSEQSSSERQANAPNLAVAGVPGAESNLPAGSAPAPAAAPTAGPGTVRTSQTRNYDVTHVTERRVQTQGRLKHIAVAVVLDGVRRTENGQTRVVPRERADLARIEALVKSAVGYTESRGDSVTVESVPFATTEQEVATPAAARRAAVVPAWRRYAPMAGAGLAGLVVLGVLASVLRRRRTAEAAPVEAELTRPAALEAPANMDDAITANAVEPEARLEGAHARELEGGDRLDYLRQRAIEQAQQDPATAALVLRFWLGTLDDGAAPQNQPLLDAAE